jgi:DNA-binding CsgD family transcriptional regulator
MSRRRARLAEPPSDLAALESEDGEVVVLSFSVGSLPTNTLTAAESEVAAYVVDGRSNAEIAHRRGCSERTVANQVSSVFRKLGVRSRLELVVLAPLVNPKGR